jgi:hypothetical protein
MLPDILCVKFEFIWRVFGKNFAVDTLVFLYKVHAVSFLNKVEEEFGGTVAVATVFHQSDPNVSLVTDCFTREL